MRERWLLVGCLAVVIVGRGLNCLYTTANLCARTLVASPAAPLSNPTDADPNETGCLCRGALLNHDCPLADLKPTSASASMCVVADMAVEMLPPLDRPTAVADFFKPPPRSAHRLRALLASWQI